MPGRAAAAEAQYPYAGKPCVWAPYAASGSGAGWCADYDFGDTPNDTSSANVISPYGYYYRNCTDYTAWRVSAEGVEPAQYKGLGNAKDWAANAPAHGLSVDGTPAVGAVGVSASGSYGHTAYVEAINPAGYPEGTIEVSQYNYAGDGNYSRVFGTPALLGLMQFVHFEAYRPAPSPDPTSVPLLAPAAAISLPAASEPVAAVLVASDNSFLSDTTDSGLAPADGPLSAVEREGQNAAASAPEETTEPPPEPSINDAAVADNTDTTAAPEPWPQSASSPPLLHVTTPSHQSARPAPYFMPAAVQTPGFASWPLVGLAVTVLLGESAGRRYARHMLRD
ncbi:MAG TPA: CHAP domain-containing protein [Bacillota bacterium]|nr:CHAP domain-containing protein [Bacillota bacterium]